MSAPWFDQLKEAAESFAQHVLDCDSYGCENGPASCLHAEASRQLDLIRQIAHSHEGEGE